MTALPKENRSSEIRLDLRMAWSGALLLAILLLYSIADTSVVGAELTRNTIRASLAWYCVALLLMMHLRGDEWKATSVRGRVARWSWTWGVVCFVMHLGMAFHFFHHWSHAHAFAHTREVSGVGEGIYVSYLFTVLWMVDVLWWWTWPEGFANRSVWWDRSLHSFMLFIVFNGMIVYESGMIRWVGAAMFTVLAIAWMAVRFPRRLQPDYSRTGEIAS